MSKEKRNVSKLPFALFLVGIFLIARLLNAPEAVQSEIDSAPKVSISQDLVEYLHQFVLVEGTVVEAYSLDVVGGTFALSDGGGKILITTNAPTPSIGDKLVVCIYVKRVLQINETSAIIGIEQARKKIKKEENDYLDFISKH
jgi:hypothetical protein